MGLASLPTMVDGLMIERRNHRTVLGITIRLYVQEQNAKGRALLGQLQYGQSSLARVHPPFTPFVQFIHPILIHQKFLNHASRILHVINSDGSIPILLPLGSSSLHAAIFFLVIPHPTSSSFLHYLCYFFQQYILYMI